MFYIYLFIFFKSDRLTNLDFVVIKKKSKKFQTKIYTLAHLRICVSPIHPIPRDRLIVVIPLFICSTFLI